MATMKRNLVYHVFPRNPEAWKWNIRRLCGFGDAFNGKKIVIVATDETSDTIDAVRNEFRMKGAEFFQVANNPALRETAHIIAGLEKAASIDPDEITFYAHTKGTGHSGEGLEKVLRWTDCQYLLNLGCIKAIENILKTKGAAGCYLQDVRHGGADWHYSGTFFWFRNDRLFGGNWRDIVMEVYGAEGYIGRHIKREDAHALTPHVSHPLLYIDPPGPDTYWKWFAELSRAYA
jgi:hypothetical protein